MPASVENALRKCEKIFSFFIPTTKENKKKESRGNALTDLGIYFFFSIHNAITKTERKREKEVSKSVRGASVAKTTNYSQLMLDVERLWLEDFRAFGSIFE